MIRTLREMTFGRQTWLLAVAGIVAILLLVGCSSDADESPTPTARPQPAPTVQTTPDPPVTSTGRKTDVISDKGINDSVEDRPAERISKETIVPNLPVDEAASTITASRVSSSPMM